MKLKLYTILTIGLIFALMASASAVFADNGDSKAEGMCDPNKPHKVAQRLAKMFSVSCDEIVGWRDEGFGWGGIRIAYTLSANSANSGKLAAEEIFALNKEGQGWGEIAKSLGVSMKPPKELHGNSAFGQSHKPDKPGKPKKDSTSTP